MFRTFVAVALLLAPVVQAQPPLNLGPFTTVSEVGAVSRQTLVRFDESSGIYFVSAAGDNIWDTRDAFGFVWREMKGDVGLGARVHWLGKSDQPHRKAGVMLRQSLDPDAVYVDAVVHGDGLTSLQFRAVRGGPTREIQCAREAPTALRLEKRGDDVQLFAANEDGVFSATGCQIRVALGKSFLAGLAVCAHDKDSFETARFSSVTLGLPPERRKSRLAAIEILSLDTLSRRVYWYSTQALEVPSFTADGSAVCFREGGDLRRLALIGGAEPVLVGADNMDSCATAAPLLSAGQQLSQRVDRGRGRIWLETAEGKPRRLSPGERGEWLPRLAPDGATYLLLAGDARGHDDKAPAADYLLLQRNLQDSSERELARFHGGAGSLGLAPWSADGRRVVFVSREPEPVD